MRTEIGLAVGVLLIATAPAFAQSTMNPDGGPVGTGAAMHGLSTYRSDMGGFGTRSHYLGWPHRMRDPTTVGNITNQRINGG